MLWQVTLAFNHGGSKVMQIEAVDIDTAERIAKMLQLARIRESEPAARDDSVYVSDCRAR